LIFREYRLFFSSAYDQLRQTVAGGRAHTYGCGHSVCTDVRIFKASCDISISGQITSSDNLDCCILRILMLHLYHKNLSRGVNEYHP
jgi:hypothetical protein